MGPIRNAAMKGNPFALDLVHISNSVIPCMFGEGPLQITVKQIIEEPKEETSALKEVVEGERWEQLLVATI